MPGPRHKNRSPFTGIQGGVEGPGMPGPYDQTESKGYTTSCA